jgi:hypothetical protein
MTQVVTTYRVTSKIAPENRRKSFDTIGLRQKVCTLYMHTLVNRLM